MAPAKKKALPKPLPEGFILNASDKTRWRLGKIIGQGGFGLIYLGKTCLGYENCLHQEGLLHKVKSDGHVILSPVLTMWRAHIVAAIFKVFPPFFEE